MEEKVVYKLRRAVVEIRSLRQRNAILSAKVDTMEFLAMVLDTQPCRTPSQPMSMDITYELESLIEEEEKKND